MGSSDPYVSHRRLFRYFDPCWYATQRAEKYCYFRPVLYRYVLDCMVRSLAEKEQVKGIEIVIGITFIWLSGCAEHESFIVVGNRCSTFTSAATNVYFVHFPACV